MTEGPFPNESSEGLNRDVATAYAGTSAPEGPAKRAVLASLGAVATAYDVANETFDRFVDRGSQAQEDLRRRADEARLQNAGNRTRVGEALRSAMNAFLDGINVPNKADVDVINAKLNIVTRKLDDLQIEGVRESTHPAPPPSPEVIIPPPNPEGPIGI
jgi:polyhydroxyalkanoate synthesis regulator phasin